ncbi:MULTISPECIES: hypothetical protein [Proteus]|uniref:HEPN domain-containing protein n=1 Tax=Proteus mirabilis TaxID=584 RepID=A0A1Z1SXL6_PROMI|nr:MULTISPECIES: hypothetical protein [Proteus]QKJ47973.1 hypothetical protein G9394_03480 [Proteus vulgaris]ARX34726.1 hypothetical protein AM402_11435 [Proteus mirabilis]ARX35703.1 hypothetical protein AM402_16570 [Proteus mirabilis]AUT92436.1 hypothetical protein MC46_012155 [Proteus mirabilis]AUU15495.1 hypothetical protein MC53_016405 [Proteus mirabilis]
MSVTAKDFLDLAKSNLSENSSEMEHRNCISRAYYSLYHATCSSLIYCPPTTHQGVINYLFSPAERKKEPFDQKILISVGAVLKQQIIKRHMADYELNKQVFKSEAESSVMAIEKTIKKLED